MTLRLRPRARPAAVLGLLSLGLATTFLAGGSGARAGESKNIVTLQVRVLQDGAPVDADLNLTFEIYDVSSGGTALWTESQTAVPVRNGILATKLGDITSLGNVFKSGLGATTDRWVAIKQGGTEIVPRVKLTAVPYAQGATTADIASKLWNATSGTAIDLSQLADALDGTGLEANAGLLRLATATGAGLTGGGGSALAVNPAALLNDQAAEVDGDKIEIDWTPTNYTRTTVSGTAPNTDDLTAHLNGIDIKIGTLGGGGGSGDPLSVAPGGRLSLSSTDPVPSADISGASAASIYYLPYLHKRIPIWDGSSWVLRDIPSGGVSLNFGGTSAGQVYDLFLVWNGSSLGFNGVLWSSGTSRGFNIARRDGIWVYDSNHTHRLVGTIRFAAANQCEDSVSKRYVWNLYNRVPCYVRGPIETANSWTYSSTSWRQANNNTANKVEVVCGLSESMINLTATCWVLDSAGNWAAVGIGVDSTTTNSAFVLSSMNNATGPKYPFAAQYGGAVALGYHYFTWLEKSNVISATTTFYGDNNNPTYHQAGIAGTWER